MKEIKVGDIVITVNDTQYSEGENFKMKLLKKGSVGEVLRVSNYRTYTIKFNEGEIVVRDNEVKKA